MAPILAAMSMHDASDPVEPVVAGASSAGPALSCLAEMEFFQIGETLRAWSGDTRPDKNKCK
ncbi:hypothetical protein AA309_17170 [Microvirga vignae]|uniref:Uncharacterized protein n=1 Tax=Microvirga vignae TaxID=1225564 RepID=A0A0H1RAA8_9HYPH|nr:hypothetical protein [Microvirga vignae]KLK92133.1 hypothetical protein AA309_17170 [Microvirga vignae]